MVKQSLLSLWQRKCDFRWRLLKILSPVHVQSNWWVARSGPVAAPRKIREQRTQSVVPMKPAAWLGLTAHTGTIGYRFLHSNIAEHYVTVRRTSPHVALLVICGRGPPSSLKRRKKKEGKKVAPFSKLFVQKWTLCLAGVCMLYLAPGGTCALSDCKPTGAYFSDASTLCNDVRIPCIAIWMSTVL